MKTKYPKRLAKDEVERSFYQVRRVTETQIVRVEHALRIAETTGSRECAESVRRKLVALKRIDLLLEASADKILGELTPPFKAALLQDLLVRNQEILREAEEGA